LAKTALLWFALRWPEFPESARALRAAYRAELVICGGRNVSFCTRQLANSPT
jgi:hypothetical protein